METQGLILVSLLLLCCFSQAKAQVPCGLNFSNFDDFKEINIQQLAGRWYRVRWGAYLSTQVSTPWSSHMLIVAKSEAGANATSFHVGIRQAVHHDRCIAGPGNFSPLNTTEKTYRFSFELRNTSIAYDVTYRIMDIEYDEAMLMVFCASSPEGNVCQGEDLEFILFSRTTEPDDATIKRLEEKMKLHCIRDTWIMKDDLAPCDALNQAGQANCPVNVNLMKYVSDVDYTKLAGKWYQITYVSNYTTYRPVWPDYLMELTSEGSYVKLAAQIRQKSSDKECLMAQGKMVALDGYDSLYTSTLVNEQANLNTTYISRILEVDFESYIVFGICGGLKDDHCEISEVTVWSRQKYLSSEQLMKLSHWYKYMCLKTEWISTSEQKPCDGEEPTQAAINHFPHISLLLAMTVVSCAFAAESRHLH